MPARDVGITLLPYDSSRHRERMGAGPSHLVGTLGGLGTGPTGVRWFDAHGDFNTPESTLGGFLDGMALAIATGRCWIGLAATVPGFTPVAEENVVLVGARDLDPAEGELLRASRVQHLPSDAPTSRIASAIEVRGRSRRTTPRTTSTVGCARRRSRLPSRSPRARAEGDVPEVARCGASHRPPYS